MIDKEEYPELYKATEAAIDMRLRWLRQAAEAQALCSLLPEDIKMLHFISVDLDSDGLAVHLHNEKDTIDTLKVAGIQQLKPEAYSENFFVYKGKSVLPNGTELRVVVSSDSKPEGCQLQVEKKRVTHTEYKLVCEETGEPI